MPLGAAIGGAAQGASQGLGRFSQALMQVMNAQQNRAYARQEQQYRANRDRVTDKANEEARKLQRQTLEARVRSEDRHFEQQLRSGGFDYEYHPEGAPMAAGAGGKPSGVGSDIARRFVVGGYNPDKDPHVLRARAMTPEEKPFDLKTDPQYLRQEALTKLSHSLREPAAKPSGLSAERQKDLIDATMSRLTSMGTGREGEVGPPAPDWLKLRQVMDEHRQRGASLDDIKFLEEYFKDRFENPVM